MSQVAISGNASGTGTLTIAAPNTNSNYTLTLPTATTTFVGTDATQTLTNKIIQGGAITSGTAVASTSGTSIDFTGIPSWVKRITVMFSGLSTNGTNHYLIQLGSGSATTSGYLGAGTRANGGAGSTVTSNTGTAGFLVQNLSGASNVIQGAIAICLLNSATNLWVASGCYGNSDVVATSYTGGSIALSGTLDRVRITTVGSPATDTFDAGTINILYE